MPDNSKRATVRIGPQGRVVLPAHLRRALELFPGDTLVAWAEDGRLILERPDTVLERLRGRFRGLPVGLSLADELISERRTEAIREAST
jgi:AbrB family looped-hinge helix DNA binding protein